MKTEFIDYTEAIALKELGFDEPCFKVVEGGPTDIFPYEKLDVPIYQQAFRFFRESHGLIYSIGHIGHTNTWAYEIINMRIAGPDYGYGETYEEAELECLKKLIEIVKNK